MDQSKLCGLERHFLVSDLHGFLYITSTRLQHIAAFQVKQGSRIQVQKCVRVGKYLEIHFLHLFGWPRASKAHCTDAADLLSSAMQL